jgi:hypothetical protein
MLAARTHTYSIALVSRRSIVAVIPFISGRKRVR